jgi:hypothetical protein
MSTIKWGQRCIARRFETVEGVVSWHETLGNFVGKECIVYTIFKDGSCGVSFEADGVGGGFCWLASALEPIPETPNVWWPEIGERVVHQGQIKTVTDRNLITHQLDRDDWVHVQNLSPIPTTEITPEEAVKLLEQHTGKSFTIKSK